MALTLLRKLYDTDTAMKALWHDIAKKLYGVDTAKKALLL